ncbi:hypothetical protein DNTS_004509 [Danionella cerebrum]|uniref:Uncharacterized protein n=1 Tax=Danionella cerebrum TaxID=2873325 RepID=A0A553QL82_9TELE|nr:hypothetical protein DNTS_004509 [Danionella translucida]
MNQSQFRETEKGLQLGKLYTAPEGLEVGLVDELVPEEKVLSSAAEAMSKWLAIPDHARQLSKSMMKKPTIDRLLAAREADIRNFGSFITRDSIQKSLGMYMEKLKKKRRS